VDNMDDEPALISDRFMNYYSPLSTFF